MHPLQQSYMIGEGSGQLFYETTGNCFDNVAARQAEICDCCKGRVSHFKIPRCVRFVDEFPMTVTGKVRAVEMRAMICEELRNSARREARAAAAPLQRKAC